MQNKYRQIKIIRHAERVDHKNPLYWMCCIGQFWMDSPLTHHGHETAKLKGEIMINDNFDPSVIYASPYIRTLATATEIKQSFTKANVVIEPLLAEYQYSHTHRINLYPNGIETTHNGKNTKYKYPETHELFKDRIQYIINSIIDQTTDDVLIVTHGEFISVIINLFVELYKITNPFKSIPYLACVSFMVDTKNILVEDTIVIN
jgi:broad specificity phosphatase PhoE